ncbi:MAG: glycosyltransferase family 2 protein [Elusimicrobia bacterium]|nr:glycosyltransferase family 2 protein [Elusimicrobiota bacterium]
MNNAKVSIIIPVYKVEKYLRQCLDSVINQTFKEIEIICINDCSPDNSLQIIKEYQQKDKRIVLVNLNKNVGLGFARNEGMKVAKCEYIVFVDSDDWVSETFVESLYKLIEEKNVDFVSFNYMHVYENDKVLFRNKVKSKFYNTIVSSDKDKQQILSNLPTVTVWNRIIKRDFLIRNNIWFRVNKLEDVLFTWESIIKSNNFLFSDKYLYYYHRVVREDSLMMIINKKPYGYRLYSYKKLKQMLKDINAYEIYNKNFYYYVTFGMMLLMEKQKRKTVFFDFKKNFYDNSYKLEYSYSQNFFLKLRLFIFNFCLKTNINYYPICKILSYIRNKKINLQLRYKEHK